MLLLNCITSLFLFSTFYYVFIMLSIYFSTCLLIVYPFSMQVIDQDEPRQGIIGLLGEEDAPEESY